MSIWIVLVLLLVGCFAAEDGPSNAVEALRSEVEFVEDEGLEGSVSIDSLTWLPFLPQPGFGTTAEFEGVFAAVFRNVGEATVWVRYDLRFFRSRGIPNRRVYTHWAAGRPQCRGNAPRGGKFSNSHRRSARF